MRAQADSNDYVALVTGAAGGIGLAVATRLAEMKRQVVLVDVQPSVMQAARRLQDAGFDVQAQVGDITDEAWIRRCVAGVIERYGSVGILVNNAGISPKTGGRKVPVEKMTLDEWNRVMAVNLSGAFLLCREVIPAMRQRRWGRIINMSSQGGRTWTRIAGAHYAASKAGMIGFTRTLAAELAGDAITVNCIAPGRIESEMARGALAASNREFLAGIPLGRTGLPTEIAAAVAFLVSDEAGYITGTTLDINGGSFMN